MPSSAPKLGPATADQLVVLGAQLRAHRKALKVNATAAAQAAGMSRITWYRIERGETAVTMGAYMAAAATLGLLFTLAEPDASTATNPVGQPDHAGWIPARIKLAQYPELQRLAWQLPGAKILTPREALDIYERNARHVDLAAMEKYEQDLLEALRIAFQEDRPGHAGAI